jgi:UDP-N-acetylmuramoyl-tripeptide--D-alanyl-D-alanine ligase
MRGFGQIAHLAAFSKPTVGVITNIGFAHLELVESREGIAVAKGELLEALGETGTSVLWHEDDYLDNLRRIAKGRVVTFGTAAGADCRIVAYRPQSWSSLEIGGSLFGKPWLAKLQAVGRHVAIDAAAAVLAASVAGVKAQDAADALQHATFPPMRMEITDMNGATVLLDTYNASPPSMIAAIQTLHDLPVLGRRMAVIGEMKELGEYTEEGHRSVGRALVEFGIDEVIFYGPAMDCGWHESIGAGANRDRFRVANSLCDVTEFLQSARSGDAVLIKGSRALELERALPREGVSAK